ncbi:hypothetical protein [Candidatus Nitrosotenuis chungbukensis]|uniref:hypothetical protein n=1 Tax=Candidatus Nitrosotenuis chungbukensis TaxID=1353246 RepID=UPI0006943E81|nr:hypothetical protein [Candidatus Nitrosotenuis chungbukensis]
MKYHILMFCVLMICLVSPGIASAEIQITSSKKTYSYGDYLSIIISVSEVTGDNAIMHIIDSDGVKSTAIQIQIKNAVTTITSPNSFDVSIFKEGEYQIEIEYAGQKGTTVFEIVDSGNTVMPLASNVVVPEWTHGTISDYTFLKFLADSSTISLQGGAILENIKIPPWYKTNGLWWADKKISDAEFVNGLQYLLDERIIS